MKTNINIIRKNNLTEKMLNKYLLSKNTINLTNKKYKKDYSDVKYIVSSVFMILLLLCIVFNKTNAYNEDKLLNYTNLNDCRIVQNENTHIEKGNWSVYAYDIACIRWKSFEVFAPNYKDIYVIKYIWYDSRLWNYVTIKHWNLYFVFWHTKTELKVWDSLKSWELIWKTDVSWMSQNYHLHLELWEWQENISFEYLSWNWSIKNPKSFELREQRNWLSWSEINIKILDFIKQFEWLRTEAYFDINHWSIWIWTPSYKWEVIIEKEAGIRARIEIQNIRDRYSLHNHPLNIQIAVTSFIYNIWSLDTDQLWLLNNYYYTALWNNFINYNWYYKDWKKIVLWWLIKRRQAEINLL